MRKYLQRRLSRLLALDVPTDDQFYEDYAEHLREIRAYALTHGHPHVAQLCRVEPPLTLARVIDVIGRCLAALPDDNGGPLTVAKVAQELGVSKETVYRL